MKAYHSLGHVSEESLKKTQDTLDETDLATESNVPYYSIRNEYRRLIAERLRQIIRWVLHVFQVLEPKANMKHYHEHPILITDVNNPNMLKKQRGVEDKGPACSRQRDRQSKPLLIDKTRFQGRKLRDQKWFCALITWYVMYQDLSVPKTHQQSLILGDKDIENQLPTLLKVDNEVENPLLGLQDPYTCIIRSYHSYSIAQIAKVLKNSELEKDKSSKNEQSNQTNAEDLSHKIWNHQGWGRRWQDRAEHAIRLFNQGRLAQYSVGHEIANLVLLSREITEKRDNRYNEGLLAFIEKLIGDRQKTQKVHSGLPLVRRFDAEDVQSGTPYAAPWELSCLEHHLPLNWDLAVDKRERMEDCKEFLLADYTFAPTWDPSKASAEGLWWDLCTSSIISTKLLINAAKHAWGISDLDPDLCDQTALSTKTSGLVIQQGDIFSEMIKEQKEKMTDLKNAQRVNPDLRPGFTWRKLRPRARYHPDTFVQSLKDTPKLFQTKEEGEVSVRSWIARYLEKRHIIWDPIWKLADIKKKIPAEELRHTSVFDLSLSTSDNEVPKIGFPCITGRADSLWKKNTGLGRDQIQSIDDIAGEVKLRKLSRPDPWDIYFLDKNRQYRQWYGLNAENDQNRQAC